MSGRIGDLSAEQEAMLKKLTENIQDVATPRCTELYILRFLRARKWDLEASEAMIRKALAFHKQWKSDTLLETWKVPEVVHKYYVGGFQSMLDKQGFLITIQPYGNWDLKGFVKSLPHDELIRAKIYEMETLEKRFRDETEKRGQLVDRICAIVDVHGLNSRHTWGPAIQLFNQYSVIEADYYPEFIGKVFIVRTPRIFPLIYGLVKTFLDPVTREKIEICSNSNMMQRLRSHMDDDQIHEVFGGKFTDPDKEIVWGGLIPAEFYPGQDDSYDKVFVKRGSYHDVEVKIEREGVTLQWDFCTHDHDIGFSVLRITEEEEHVVVPTERHNAHHAGVMGTHTVTEVGLYRLRFDNTYSWTRGKNLTFKYNILEPISDDVHADITAKST